MKYRDTRSPPPGPDRIYWPLKFQRMGTLLLDMPALKEANRPHSQPFVLYDIDETGWPGRLPPQTAHDEECKGTEVFRHLSICTLRRLYLFRTPW